MPLPEKRKAAGGESAAFQSDHMGGDQVDSSAVEDLSGTVEGPALAAAMAATDVERLLNLVRRIPRETFSTIEGQVIWRGIQLAVEAGQPPHPIAVVVELQRAEVELPPAWLGCPTSRLFEIAADPPPVVMLDYLFEQVQDQALRRDARRILLGLADRMGRGDLQQLATVIQTETGGLLARLAEVTP